MNYMYCLCILFHKIKMSLFKNEKNLSVRLFISHNKYTLTQNFFMKFSTGLWLPPRTNLNQSISIGNPGIIDQRIYNDLLKYLSVQKIEFSQELDFRNAYIKNGYVYIGDICLSKFDIFIWFGVINRNPGSHDLETLRTLSLTTKIANSYEYMTLGSDKFRAFSLLHHHQIPVSDFLFVNQRNIHEVDLSHLGSSVLLKPRRGGFGIGIIKIDSPSQLRDIVDYLSNQKDESFYIEKYYENDMSQWIGLTVINGNILYGYRKKADKIADWKIYDRNQIGGGVDLVIPNDEQIKIAESVYKILKANFFGLDIIKSKDGYKVVDINYLPGLYYDFIQELKIDFPKIFFRMLHQFY